VNDHHQGARVFASGARGQEHVHEQFRSPAALIEFFTIRTVENGCDLARSMLFADVAIRSDQCRRDEKEKRTCSG